MRVHLSSSPNFEGPRLAKPLNSELKAALAQAEAVILVFTTDTEDWSYRMWECGVATDPRNKHQHLSSLCSSAPETSPSRTPTKAALMPETSDSLPMFVKSLLTTTDVFSNRDQPVTGFAAEGLEISQFAAAAPC